MIPPLIKVRQELGSPELAWPSAELLKGLALFSGKIRPGQTVAIAAGSRGIGRTAELVKVVVEWVKARGGRPFIVPAMGSHGASTSEGQKRVLAGLGISERAMGCPVRSEIDAREMGKVMGARIFTDRHALKADHLVLVNRIKPHTSFHAKYESGLCKMLTVGLGKRKGAEEMHRRGPERLGQLIPAAAGFLLSRLPVLCGVAVLENFREGIAGIDVLSARDILKREPALLKRAWRLLPRLPFKELEVLVIDQIGKDKSGTGMDTNVVGRLDLRGMADPAGPRIRRIVALGLSPKSAGAAYGIGLADITTKRVVDKMDRKAMRENALASTYVERARTPLWFDSDRDAILAAVASCWCPDLSRLRLCRIRSTLELEQMWITRNLIPQSMVPMSIIGRKASLRFDASGNLES